MIEVWPQVIELSETVIQKFSKYIPMHIPEEYAHDHEGVIWKNYMWMSQSFRRAHIEILDARESKKMWIMHMTIYPHLNCPDPIFGFDVVCGKNKITGAFHDFSAVGDSELYFWYYNKMAQYNWSKPRELPEWAQLIFSPYMVAAGNIQTQEELDKLKTVFIDNLDHYLYNVGKKRENKNFINKQNYYSSNQKKNPHTPAMMETFGIDKDLFRKFMDDVLFPER